MFSFNDTYNALSDTRLHPWVDQFKDAVHKRMADYTHGNITQWIATTRYYARSNRYH